MYLFLQGAHPTLDLSNKKVLHTHTYIPYDLVSAKLTYTLIVQGRSRNYNPPFQSDLYTSCADGLQP